MRMSLRTEECRKRAAECTEKALFAPDQEVQRTFIRSLMRRSLRLPDAAPLAASPSEVRQPPLHIHLLAERFAELID